MTTRPLRTLSSRAWDEPHLSRLAVEHPRRADILRAHAAAVADDSPGYLDPASGLFVLTSAYLAQRGFCCERGCRHCPYIE